MCAANIFLKLLPYWFFDVIGGIFVESTQESAEGIPGLMNVPILGHLFKSQKKQTVKDELLIFITPRIMHTK